MTPLPASRGTFLFLVLAASFLVCRTGSLAAPASAAYRVEWSAKRADNSAPLRSASAVVRAGQRINLRTDSTRPGEDQPAFPEFTVALSPVRGGGSVFELYIRVGLREIIRTRKGKLKKKQRNISALIPIRPGETQQVSSASDQVRLDVHLERR